MAYVTKRRKETLLLQ